MLLFNTLFIILLSRDLQAQDEFNNISLKIAGGQEATVGAYPFMVSVRNHYKHFCGGTIISEKFILTAASCVANERASDISIVVGTNKASSRGTSYDISRILKHPDYNIPNVSDNNIALLEVKISIQMNPNVQPVNLNFNCLNDNSEYDVNVVGWRYKFINLLIPNKLLFANVKMIAQCKNENQICTLHSTRRICRDSGTPLLYNGQQIGVNSFVNGFGCIANCPTSYTKICRYASWIYFVIYNY